MGNASPILGYTKLGRFIQRKKYFFEYKHSTQFVREHTEDNLLPFLPGRDPSLKGRSPYLPTYLLGTQFLSTFARLRIIKEQEQLN